MLEGKTNLKESGIGLGPVAAVAGVQGKLVACFIIEYAFRTPWDVNKRIEEWEYGESSFFKIRKVRRQERADNRTRTKQFRRQNEGVVKD